MMHKANQPERPALPPPFYMPFYYASLSSMWLFYPVATAPARPFLDGTGLVPALFDGHAVAVIDFQRYSSHSSTSLDTTTEIEFSLLAYPQARKSQIPPSISLEDFLAGKDQTKLIGHRRLHIPTDNRLAVEAGRALFGAPKFYTTFTYRVPSHNDPTVHTWSYTCHDPDGEGAIFSVEADVRALSAAVTSSAPLTEYSVLDGELIGSHWNLLGTLETLYPNGSASESITLSLGRSQNQMREDMDSIIGSSRPVAVQIFESAPTAIEGRSFYVDVGA
ncbi:MAG: hypothetical protein MJE77_38615 [Proteobacteria bacterium]|nr:hypothetical protein [Pseudomonadota bacterium]